MSDIVLISKKVLLLNSLSGIFSHIVNLTVLVWLQQYLLKRISASEYSLYPVMISALILLYMLRMVFTGGVARFATEAYARGDERGVTQVTSTMCVITAGAAFLIALGGLFFVRYLDRILTIPSPLLWDARAMAVLMLFSFVIQLALSPLEVGLQVTQRFVLLNAVRTGANFLRVGLLFALLFGVSTRVLWVVAAAESANLAGFLVTMVLSRRAVPSLRFSLGEVKRGRARELVSFGSWSFVCQLAYRIITSADPLILNKLAAPLDVTCYHLGSLFRKHIHNAIQVMTQPVVPALTAMHAREKRDLIGKTYLRYGRYYIWAFMAVALPVIVFSREFVRLYVGEKYQLASTIMILMLTESVLFLGNFMLFSLAVATGRIKALALPVVILQFVNLALTLYLVGVLKLGAVGAALSTFIITAVSGTFVEVPLGLRLSGIGFRTWVKRTCIPGYMPAAAAAAVLAAVKFAFPPASWFSLVGWSVLGGAVYLAVLFTFALREEDRNDIARILKRVAGYFRPRAVEVPETVSER